MTRDRYLKEYRCGPCKSTEILTDQKLGSPPNGELCPKCSTRMMLLRIQPMECAIQTPWNFEGTRLVPVNAEPEPLSLSLLRQLKNQLVGRSVDPMPITQQTQERIVSDVKAGKLSYKPVPCSNCGIELSIESFMRNEGLGNDGTEGKPRYCDVCDSISKSMATCPGLIEAHEKYETDQFRKRGLIEGR